MQPAFINLDSTEFQYKAANGIYKLIPYYQKLSPELSPADLKSSRFIIHKHVITGQWQLTDFYSYPCSRNIKAFPVTDENEKMKSKTSRCIILHQTVQAQEALIQILNHEIKAKDNSIESLTIKNESLLHTCFTDLCHETKKDTEAHKQFETELVEKENEIL